MSNLATLVQVGKTAPVFSLFSDDGKAYSLKDFRGQFVVLYFYPKDNTSGCTAEACQFRDLHLDFSKLNTIILGVSRDSLKSHTKFRNDHQLPFLLLSDVKGDVCQQYGVWVEKSMYGRKYFGIERSTFLIDRAGIIQKIWRKVKVPGHAEDVLKVITTLT
jgi:peroxiredoxin Q/BCP